MASTPSTTLPSLSPEQDISPTAYITLFALGSLVLVTVITIACCSILRTRQTLDRRTGFSGEPSTGKRGIDEEILGSFSKMMFSQVKIQYNDSSAGDSLWSCSICLAEYREVDMVLLLPNCGHFFHVKCVDRWLRLRPTCPVCRNSTVSGSVLPEGQEPGRRDGGVVFVNSEVGT